MWINKRRIEGIEKENISLVGELIKLREELKTVEEETEPLFRSYNVDILVLEKALIRLRENPDFDLFMKYLYGEYETSIKRMSKTDKDQHDFLKGWIRSIDAIINVEKTIKFYLNKRKELDKERNRKDNE